MEPVLKAFILAKNEEANIERSVGALVQNGIETVVLDSGSSDATREIATGLGATVQPFEYVTHEAAYRTICLELAQPGELVLILDADMIVSSELLQEIRYLLGAGSDVVKAPVRMCWEGRELRTGSLYPPKPIAFRAGKHYFEPVGHGERLLASARVGMSSSPLRHDDRKPFEAYLMTQVRYSRNLVERSESGRVNWRDWIRVRSPVFVGVTPFVSYMVAGGFLAGRAGLGYALDRLIAEAIAFRTALATRKPR